MDTNNVTQIERGGHLTKDMLKKMIPIGTWKGLKIYKQLFKKNQDIQIFVIDDKSNAVFFMWLFKTGKHKKIYEILNVYVARPYQGQNVGALLYREVIKRLDIILKAGYSQSPGARKVWAKLNNFSDIAVLAKGHGHGLHEVDSDPEIGELVSPHINLYGGDKTSAYAFHLKKKK